MAFARAGPGAKRQRVAFWQLALAASALVLLGLNVGAVFNSNFPANSDNVDEVRISISSGGGRFRSGRNKTNGLLCTTVFRKGKIVSGSALSFVVDSHQERRLLFCGRLVRVAVL